MLVCCPGLLLRTSWSSSTRQDQTLLQKGKGRATVSGAQLCLHSPVERCQQPSCGLLCARVSQLLSLATTLCSQESSNIGLPDFPVDNLLPAVHVLVRIWAPGVLSAYYPFEGQRDSEGSLRVFAEHVPQDVLPAARPEALSLQQHPGQGGPQRRGGRAQRESRRTGDFCHLCMLTIQRLVPPQRFELLDGPRQPAPSTVLNVAPTGDGRGRAEVTLRVAEEDVTFQVPQFI